MRSKIHFSLATETITFSIATQLRLQNRLLDSMDRTVLCNKNLSLNIQMQLVQTVYVRHCAQGKPLIWFILTSRVHAREQSILNVIKGLCLRDRQSCLTVALWEHKKSFFEETSLFNRYVIAWVLWVIRIRGAMGERNKKKSWDSELFFVSLAMIILFEIT